MENFICFNFICPKKEKRKKNFTSACRLELRRIKVCIFLELCAPGWQRELILLLTFGSTIVHTILFIHISICYMNMRPDLIKYTPGSLSALILTTLRPVLREYVKAAVRRHRDGGEQEQDEVHLSEIPNIRLLHSICRLCVRFLTNELKWRR